MSITSVRLREAWNWGNLTAKELAVRTYRGIEMHETIDRAAAVAFYAMLSLAPLLGILIAVAVAVGDERGVSAELLATSRQLLPPEGHSVIADQIFQIRSAPPVGVLTFSFAVLLWSSTGVFVSMIDGLNAASGIRDERPWWKRRLLAIALTGLELFLLLFALVVIIARPFILHWFGLDGIAAAVAGVVQWAVVGVALLASFSVAYYFGPHAKGEREWKWITPGGSVGVVLLIAISLAFHLFLRYGWRSGETYSALAGVVLLLLWFYIAALALLVGAEINGVIEHPHGGQSTQGDPSKWLA